MSARLMVVAVLLFGCSAANASLVANGGFETGNFTGWTVTGAGFNCGSPSGISTSNPRSGTYSACFGNPTGLTFISQALATVPGQEYAFTFWYAQQPVDQAPANRIQIIWGADTLADLSEIPVTPWNFARVLVIAAGDSTTIEFGFENGPGWFALDDVSVDPLPEPQALVLCGLGLGVVGLLRRRQVEQTMGLRRRFGMRLGAR